MYRASGPEEMRPVGETEFVAGVAAMSESGQYGSTRVAAGIVGFADLTLGDRVEPVLEALVVIGLFAGGMLVFRRMMDTVGRIEERQIAPAAKRVNDILDDVKSVTEVARRAADGADRISGWWRRS